MPKIVINEIDLTSPGVIDESTDVVYIPGFVNVDENINPSLYTTNEQGKQEYVGLEVNKPTLFTSLSEFNSLCGTEPAYFSEAQRYDSLVSFAADGSETGFADEAVPYHGIMFPEGTADPSYVMAKEILSAGLCVLYQRVNDADYTTTFTNVASQPADWLTNFSNYEQSAVAYSNVNSATIPTMFKKQNGEPFNSSLTYYTRTSIPNPEAPDSSRVIAFIVATNVATQGLDIISNEGTLDSDGNVVPAYYIMDTETTKYYTKTALNFSAFKPYYIPNTYYIKVGEEYSLLTGESVPANWGQADTFYTPAGGGSYSVVSFTSAVSTPYEANTFYNLTGTAQLLTKQPEKWGTSTGNEFFSRQQAVSNGIAYYTYTSVDTTSTDFVANSFYSASFALVESESQPADWITTNTSTYYQQSGSDPAFTYTGLVIIDDSPTFEEMSTYVSNSQLLQKNQKNEYLIVNSYPTNWGTNDTFYLLGQQVVPLKIEAPINEDSQEKPDGYYIPASWASNYTNGLAQIEIWDYVQATSSGNAPAWNPSATYRIRTDGININTMYNALSSIYAISDSGLSDKGNYSIKYLTSGGYPTYEYNSNAIVTQMMDLAKERGDCVAFIDHTDNPYREQNIDLRGSLYYAVENGLTFQTGGEYATMFTPWAAYNRTTTDLDKSENTSSRYDGSAVRLPASFAYFLSLADSIEVNPNWLAIAGVNRGLVQNLASGGMNTNIPNGTADAMEPRDGIAINPITNIRPYGYTIWGNRTLKNNATAGNLTATSFLNIRNLVSDIKKEVYRVARKLTFEQNSDVLWVNFKAEMSPLLERMAHGYGINGYRLQLDTEHPRFNERATLCVKIIISPVEAVEDFYVTVVMQDSVDATVTEG